MSIALSVLKLNPGSSYDPQTIARDLAARIAGQVRFDRHDRQLYSTDASLYQVQPIGVIVPTNAADIQQVLRYCHEQKIPVLPRGGGTSLAGQCTAPAVVIDQSAFCREVLAFDPATRSIQVETGITIAEINRYLEARGSGLFYAPDPATVAQATLGGCIGNNAAGARSLVYGRTSENVTAIDVLLADGHLTTLAAGAGRTDDIARHLASSVATICRQNAAEIRARFSKTNRRNAGYGLDLILQQLDRGVLDEDLDLTGLICGSEGTLAMATTATLRLYPIPPVSALAVISFDNLESAVAIVAAIVQTGASAVELMDDVVLNAARGNTECRPYVDLLPPFDGLAPSAVLYVEYQGDSRDVIESKFDRLRQFTQSAPTIRYFDKPSLARLWALRKAGEPLLHGLSGRRKPVTFVEDNAVPVENLPRFVKEFKEIVTRHGTTAAYWAHASVGLLHVRPLLDLHDPADLQRMQRIAEEVADLARACGGVMSGEHGDGKARGPLLERFFGPQLVAAFAQIKAVFDPQGILNPGNLVGAGPVESITERMRIDQAANSLEQVETFYDYRDQDGFAAAVEMCNGAGFCRKTSSGSMCPSYRATLDERHSTRGRGNALRSSIVDGIGGDGSAASPSNGPVWNDPATLATLDLCLSCKACKSECPSSVDIAKLKAEYTAQSHRARGKVPLAAQFFGKVRLLNRLGSAMPRLSNWIIRCAPVRRLMNRLLGLAPERSIPEFAPSLLRWFRRRQKPNAGSASSPKVVLFADCFVTFNEPHIGKAAVSVLEKLGYAVELADAGCCGRAMISTGLLPQAIRAADQSLAQLRPYINDDAVAAIVVCEPSCLSAMKDDWQQLNLTTPIALRQKLAGKAMLVEEFVQKNWDRHPNPPAIAKLTQPMVLHGHCHQKALWGDQTSSAILQRLGAVTVLDAGCCGMAGSFGYLQHRYAVSMKIGELSLFPAVRSAADESLICAPGTSCRHQIKDGTGKRALHPIEVIDRALS